MEVVGLLCQIPYLLVLSVVFRESGEGDIEFRLLELLHGVYDLRAPIAPKLVLDLLGHDQLDLFLVDERDKLLQFLNIFASEMVEGKEDVGINK